MTVWLTATICFASVVAFVGLVMLLHGLVARTLERLWPDDL